VSVQAPVKSKSPTRGKRGAVAKPAAVKEKSRVETPLGIPDRPQAAPSVLPEGLQPRVDPEAEMLRQSSRDIVPPAKRDTPPEAVQSRQVSFEREQAPVDHSRQVAMHAEALRRDEWQKALEEDEARRGPNRHKNPRLPLTAATQVFREIDITEIPDNAVVPKGHSPKWVGTKDTLSTGKDSMSQIRHHQAYGYDYVRDTDGKYIVTELGVLMSATYAEAAARQNHLTPRGSMKTDDSGDGLREFAERENRRAGRRLVGVAELPDHRRRISDRLEVE
jgi:hypothetical protein